MIIGISGKAGSGKDTLAKMLMREFDRQELTLFRIGLGDAVKATVAHDQGITIAHLEKNKAHYRSELQHVGESYRAKDPEYWIRVVRGKILQHPGWNFVIPDIRYENELALVNYMVRIEGRKTAMEPNQELHRSEVCLDNADLDYVIDNCGTLTDLKREAKKLCTAILSQ